MAIWRGVSQSALSVLAVAFFLLTVSRLTWEFYFVSNLYQAIPNVPNSPKLTSKPEKLQSIWTNIDIRGGPCPISVPSERDDKFHALWSLPTSPSVCPVSPVLSQLTSEGYLQGLAGSCDKGNLSYWTADGLKSTPKQRLGLAQVAIQSQVENVFVECRISRRNATYDWHLRVAADTEPAPSRPMRHVLLLLVDSLTREHALRALPSVMKTMSESQTHSLFDFTRFNAVGKGTKMNFTPVMFGMSSKEFVDSPNGTVPSIMQHFASRGYRTAFLEEACIKNTGSMGRIINKKVKEDLTDLEEIEFMKTFASQAHHSVGNVMCHIMHMMGVRDFFSESTMRQICFAGRHMHQYLLHYIQEFIDKYRQASHSTLTILKTNEAHERSYVRVNQLDRDIDALMKNVQPDTTVVLMGDHGIGYGELSETITLTIEYNLPALFILVPNHQISAQRADIARQNQQKLITGVDLFSTLFDLMDDSFESDIPSKGLSLFRDVIPNRSCKSQGIPPNRCSCSVYTEESTNDPLWRLIGRELIGLINVATAPWRSQGCFPLYLSNLTRIHHIRGSLRTDDADLNQPQLFQVSADVIADEHERIDQFQFEIQSQPTWQRPSPDVKFVTSINIWSLDNNTSSRPFILYGPTYLLGIQIGWNATLCQQTRNVLFRFIDEKGDVQFSQRTVVQGNWTTSLSTVTAASSFMGVGKWTFVVSDDQTSRVEGIAQVVVLSRSRRRPIPNEFLTTYFQVVSMTRISQFSPYTACVPSGAPKDKCICRIDSPAEALT